MTRDWRRRLTLSLVGLSIVSLVTLGVVVGEVSSTTMGDDTPWQPTFPDGQSLITNEFAYRHPETVGAKLSPDWIVTSGSLFADEGTGWTGPIDADSPSLGSTTATGSAVLRAVSRRENFDDVRVSLDLDVAGLTTTPRTGSHNYDGVHVFLRYTSPDSFYSVSLCRRDDTAAVKRKQPGTDSDDGLYQTLAQVGMPCPIGGWQDFAVSVVDEPDGVRLTITTQGRTVVSVLDTGLGGVSPLRGRGRIGVRGDNAEFHLRNLRVEREP